MIFPEFDPVLFTIGPFDLFGREIGLPIRWYALAYVAGIVLGWRYAVMLSRREALWAPGKPPVTGLQLDDLVLWATLGVILGGRLGFALFYEPSMFGQIFTGDTWAERLQIFQIWTGGMSFHGGLIGVALALFFFARAKGVNPLRMGDLVAPVAPIGLFFGRIANFINGELWGRATDGPFGVIFCNDRIREAAYGRCPAGEFPRHPSQLYEAGLEGIVLFALLWVAVWKVRALAKPGYVMGVFLLGYGLSRVAVEFVREPDLGMDGFPLGLTMGMMLSIPMILLGGWLVWRAWSRPPASAD